MGNTPQVVASGELRYSGAKMWTAAVSVNYVGSNYIDISPVRRMRRVMDYATSPEALAQMTAHLVVLISFFDIEGYKCSEMLRQLTFL